MLTVARSAFTSSHRLLISRTTLPSTSYYPKISIRTMSDIKTATFDVSEVPAGSMKMVEVGEGKVLLSNVKGEIVSSARSASTDIQHATSAHCSHYGAPLAKGVLTEEGRVICPWHGACFNVCTGDIEDAPGLDSLYKYKAEVKDGKITVSASEAELNSKVGRVIPKARKPVTATEKERVVIVGGGGGGIHAIESLREHNYAGEIVLISKEAVTPYDRPKVSKGLVDDAKKIEWRSPDVLKGEFGVDLKLSTEVTGVDTEKQTVTTKSGDSIKYDKLILAPGAIAKRIPIEGKDLPGVITIRTPDDMKPVVNALGPDAQIVIVGTSFIGMEAAGALIAKELKSLHVVGVDDVPFKAILNEELGKAIVADYESKGIKFHLGANVQKITKADGKLQLHAEGIEPLAADIIIMGTGVGPATEFLKNSSFSLEKDGGLAVDGNLRVKGAKNVFAIGDIAHYPQQPDGNVRRVEHWNVAGNHARAVAQTIAGKETAYDLVPIFWSSVGKGLRYVSTGVPPDDEYLDGSAKELKFVLYQAKGGKVQTVASMGRDPYVAKASDLLQKGLMPSLDEIKNGKDILSISS